MRTSRSPRPASLRPSHLTVARAGWFAAGVGAVASVQALTVDVHPSVQLHEAYNSNVYLLTPAQDTLSSIGSSHRGDFITQGMLGLKLALTQSLQKLDLSGEYGHDDYSRFHALDNDHYKFKGVASLVLAHSLTATLSASKDRFLQSEAGRTDLAKGYQRESRAAAEVALAITPEISIKPEVDALRERYTLDDQTVSDLDENATQLSLEYRRASLSAAGIKLRNVEGDYPHRGVPVQGQEVSYHQRSADAFASYIPSGLSQFDVEIGYTQRRHDDPTVPDFSGPTGKVSYRRTISGKTYVQLDAFRRLQPAYEIGVNYERESGGDIVGNYAFSGKTALAVGYSYLEDGFVGSESLDPRNIGRIDHANIYRIGFEYEPARKFLIEPQFSYEKHDSSRDDRSYQFGAAVLNLKYTY